MKYCWNCGNQIADDDVYCQKCGKSQSQTNDISVKIPEKTSKAIFDFEFKKNIWSSIIIYVIAVVLLMLLHIFIPETKTSTEYFKYLLNAGASFYFVLLVAYLRGMGSKSWVIAIIAGLIGYLTGGYFGILFIFYPLLKNFKTNKALETILRKAVLNKILLGGVFWYLLGIFLTLGSWSIAKEGETYTIFWGLVVYGLWLFARVIYYCANPASLDILGQKELEKLQARNTEELKSDKSNIEITRTEVKKLPLLSNKLLMWIVIIVGGYVVLYYSGVFLYQVMFPK